MSEYLSPGDPTVPTDLDILGVYAARIAVEHNQQHLWWSATVMANRLLWIVEAEADSPFTPAQLAAAALTELGEAATPLLAEGVPD